jgi:hypothetical protein
LVQEEQLDLKENEVILVNLEKKVQLVHLVCLVHPVHLVQEENAVKKVHLENLEHLVLEEDLEIKVHLVLLVPWVLQEVLECQVLLEKLVHLDPQVNVENGVKVALQVLLVPLVCLVNLAHQVFKDLPVKKASVEEKVPKDTED